MPTSLSPLITTAAPMSSLARTLIASSTLWSGRTAIALRAGLFLRSSATVFIAGLLSHVRVVRSSPALRNDPLDVLAWILDVAGLAMHAVGRVDLQPRAARFLD